MAIPLAPGFWQTNFFPAGYWQVPYQYWQHWARSALKVVIGVSAISAAAIGDTGASATTISEARLGRGTIGDAGLGTATIDDAAVGDAAIVDDP